MEKKVTKRDMFKAIYADLEKANVENKVEKLGFIDHELELLDDKKARTTLTKTQKANIGLMDEIKAVLAEADKGMTVNEILKSEAFAERYANGELSNPKITALLTKMGDKGTREVTRSVEKKVAYYSIARD